MCIYISFSTYKVAGSAFQRTSIFTASLLFLAVCAEKMNTHSHSHSHPNLNLYLLPSLPGDAAWGIIN